MRQLPNRPSIQIEANNWVRGIITEASPLNFPEGASLDEENFVLDRDGTRARRLGLDYEAPYSLIDLGVSATASNYAIQNFLWKNVNEDPETNWLAHQFGNKIYLFDSDLTAVSTNLLYTVSLTSSVAFRFSFATIQGKLVVAIGDQNLRIFSFDISDSLTVTQSRLKVRDFWGVEDYLKVDERFSGTFSSTVGALHAYNLYNQGWPPEFFCSSDPENPSTMDNGTVEDPVIRTKTSLGKYPSNADVMYTGKTMLTNGRSAYYPHALNNIQAGNTPAANGHYIIDLFNRSQGRKDSYDSDVSAGWSARFNYKSYIPTDQSTGGIKAVAAYAGRIFYACSSGEIGGDSKSPHIGTFVLFSQLVDSVTDLGNCYQEADPTAEDISDLIDTDGGYIQFPDAVNIKALIPFRSSLLVFADNGVWEITGGDRGFTATEYQSKLITTNGPLSSESIVVTPDAVLYWSRIGIFALTQGQVGAQIESITERTIQKLYNSIPYESKQNALGFFDDVNYRCRWLYQSKYTPSFSQRYTHELVLDLSMPAWSRLRFGDKGTIPPRVTGYVEVPPSNRTSAKTEYKYSILASQTSSTYAMTTGYFRNDNFLDWYTANSGTDAAAYLVTGYITGGDSARKKYAPWLTVHCRRSEIFVPEYFAESSDFFFQTVVLLMHGDGEMSSTAVMDHSSYTFSLSAIGATGKVPFISTTQKKWNTASLYFRGSGQSATDDGGCIISPINDVFKIHNNDYTIEMWLYPELSLSTNFCTLIDTRNDSITEQNALTLRLVSENKLGLYYNGNYLLTSDTSIPLNEWTHVALTRWDGNTRFFINGLVDTAVPSSQTTNRMNGTRVYVGCDSFKNQYKNGYKGYIDDLRITNGYSRFLKSSITWTNTGAVPGGDEIWTTPYLLPTNPYGNNPDNRGDDHYWPLVHHLIDVTDDSATSELVDKSYYSNTVLKSTKDCPNLEGSINGSRALYFDGSGPAYLGFGIQAELRGNSFTMESWFQPTSSLSATITLFAQNKIPFEVDSISYVGNYMIYISNGVLRYRFGSGGTSWVTQGNCVTLTQSAVHHIAIERYNLAFKIYLDGVQVGSATAESIVFGSNKNRLITIGGDTEGHNFVGHMNGYRLTKGDARYKGTFVPPTLPYLDT